MTSNDTIDSQYFEIVNLDEDTPNDEEWLFTNLFPRVGVAILNGDASTGKSFLILRLIACLSTELKIFGHFKLGGKPMLNNFAFPTKTGSAVYISTEGKGFTRKRIKAAFNYLDEEEQEILGMPDLPIIVIHNKFLKLEAGKQISEMKEVIKDKIQKLEKNKYPLRLIVFDILLDCFSVNDENSSTEMAKVFNGLRQYAKEFDCLVVAVMHPAKGKGNKHLPRGGISTVNLTDTLVTLTKKKGSKERELKIVKSRNSDGADAVAKYNFDIIGEMPFFIPVDNKHTKISKNQNDNTAVNFKGKYEKFIYELLKSTPKKEYNFQSIREFYIASLNKNKIPSEDALQKGIPRALHALTKGQHIYYIKRSLRYCFTDLQKERLDSVFADIAEKITPPPKS